MLVKTILRAEDLKNEFARYNRDYYSLEACQCLIDLFEECDCGKPTELDVIAICCDFYEDTIEDIKANYSNIEEIANAETNEELLDALNYHTIAYETTDNCILYQAF